MKYLKHLIIEDQVNYIHHDFVSYLFFKAQYLFMFQVRRHVHFKPDVSLNLVISPVNYTQRGVMYGECVTQGVTRDL